MARGRIDGKKIKVSDFRSYDEQHEEIYKVVAVGTSTAEASAGESVESNAAIILHEKHAWIQFAGSCSNTGINCNGLASSCLLINTKNIKPGSINVAQYPSFVESYKIEKVNNETYKLLFCRYPNYEGGSAQESFVVSGYDIYGNLITSSDEAVNPFNANQGSISLHCASSLATSISVPWNADNCQLVYELSPEIETNSIVVNEKNGGITGVTITPAGNVGTVLVKFPQNNSQSFECVYHISIKGKNIYGDTIYSETVSITQEKKGNSSQFYITGEDIEYNETVGTFKVHYPSTISADSIGVKQHSSNISSVTKQSGGIINFNASTDVNTGTEKKELWITVTGRTTTDGTVMTISGTLYQGTGAYILISGRTDYPNTAAGDPQVNLPYYTQSHSFKYTAFGIFNISVSGDTSFTSNGGTATLNRTTKTVSLRFPRNEGDEDKTFVITVYGNDSSNRTIRATYTFTHESISAGGLRLTSGATETGSVEYDATSFQLTVTIPDDITPSTIGVSKNTSDSEQYKVYRTSVSSDGTSLTCYVYKNLTPRTWPYTLQVSGKTQDNQIKFSNEFIAYHKTNEPGARIEFNNSSATVDASATSLNVAFSYNELDFVYVAECTADDNSVVTTSGLSYSNGNGSIILNFTSYPASTRTITLSLAGMDSLGNIVETNPKFTLTQNSDGEGRIEVVPSSITVPNSPTSLVYEVRYIGVTPGPTLYNASVFTNVTDETANIITYNDSMLSNTYTITFTGTKLSGGSVSGELTVIQQGRQTSASLHIKSSDLIYVSGTTESGLTYRVSPEGGNYALTITHSDITYSTLQAFVNPTTGATANTSTQQIKFAKAPVQGSGSGSSSCDGNKIGSIVSEDKVNIPVGNNSSNYCPELWEILKDDESKLSGETYVFHTYINPLGEEPEELKYRVYATATGIDGTPVTSNTIYFLQAYREQGSGGGGGGSDCDYTILIRENLTPEANARLDYHGSVTDLILPREECRRAGDSTRFIVFADGYISQIIVDTENLREDVTKDVYLELLSEGQLVVRLLNFSTQHTNHYISYSQVGTTINVTVQPYIASNRYRRCRVSFIVDHDGAYGVNVPDNASKMLEATRGTSTDIWYVQFELEADTTFETFTVSNANTTYTFNVTIGGSSSQSASIQTGLDENPGTVPGSGGSITFVTRFKNVDVDTIGFVPEASEIQSITPDFSTLVDDGNGYYEFTSTAVLTRNTTNTGYQEDCSKYYTVTGTSLLNGSTVSNRQRFWQTAWRELKFYVHSSSQEVYDGETEDSNNMSLNISSWSNYTIDLESVNEWIVFNWDGTHKSGPATENDVYRFDIDYNIGDSRRSCTIYAENQTARQTFTFWQSARALYGCSLSLSSQSPTTVPAAGGEVILTFTYSGFDNPNWTELRYDENEISDATDLNMSGASGTGTVKVTVKPNTTGRTRQVALTIGGNSRAQAKDMSGELYITQAG